jgi:hypothetical protein
MKKKNLKYLILVIFLFSMAPNSYAVGVDFGGKFGIGAGWWHGSDYDKSVKDVTGAFDFNIGPYCALDFHKYISMQFALLFSYIGNGDEYDVLGSTVERKLHNFAFQVPVLAKPKFPLGPGEIFILAGFDIIILLSDFTAIAKLGNTETTTNIDVGRQFHLGISCGLGYDWKLGPGKLQFAIKITPFITHYGGNFSRAYQNEITFDFGYAYAFKKR